MSPALNDWSLPPIPPELKHLTPYFQRAQELRTRDPVMAYWCAFYGLQTAIGIKFSAVNRFITNVLPVLEQIKATHASNETITNDAAAAAYVENFALRVFAMADNEDRKGLATRATAKKFLASANFLEVVQIFRPLSAEDSEKIRYAKWKAADIAKAFREGREPIPGDAPSLPIGSDPMSSPHTASLPLDSQSRENEVTANPTSQPSPLPPSSVPLPPSDVDTQSPARHSTSWSSPHPDGSSLSHSPETVPSVLPSAQSLSPRTPPPRPFLDIAGDELVTPGMWSTVATPGAGDMRYADGPFGNTPSSPSDAITLHELGEHLAKGEGDTPEDAWSIIGNISTSRQNSGTAPENNTDLVPPPVPPVTNGLDLHERPDVSLDATPGIVKRVHFSPSVVGGLSSASNSVAGSSPPGSPARYTPSLPTVDETSYPPELPFASPRMYPLPDSDSSTSESPRVIPPPIVHRVQSGPPPGHDSPSLTPYTVHHFSPHLPGIPSPPSDFHPTLDQSSPAPPPLSLAQIAQAQKYCRFAVSALDFEDIETARMELRRALAMLGD